MDPAVMLEAAGESHLKSIAEASASGDSSIQKFYDGSTIFLTGGSGFLGKQLIEKLFRSCNVKKIYMLVRKKKEMTVEERLAETLKDSVFDAVKKLKPDFASRIGTVEGNIADNKLGISDEDLELISEEVNVIFHVAATTRFDENLRDATFINVRGTREALLLAKSCQKLRSFVYVSTAYSHATSTKSGGQVVEQFHESPIPPETLIHMAERVERSRLDAITPPLIKGWPNTYCFTKAVAEEQVRLLAAELPVCIVRPSIVISSYREPCPGWLIPSCAFSASGLLISTGVGLNHVIHTAKNTEISLVPVDFVNNTIIAAAWNTALRKKDAIISESNGAISVIDAAISESNGAVSVIDAAINESNGAVSVIDAAISGKEKTISGKEVMIYSIVTSTKNKIHWKAIQTIMEAAADTIPTPRAIWRSWIITTSSYPLYLICVLLFHFVPGLFLDGVCLVIGKEAGFIKLYKKIHKLSGALAYFMTNLHKMDDRNLNELRQNMSEVDREIFNFDMMPVNWLEMMTVWCLGVRKYIIKDGLTDNDKAIKKQFWFKILNYLVVGLYGYVFWTAAAFVIKIIV